MPTKKPRSSVKKKISQYPQSQGVITVKGTTAIGKKVAVTTGDKNAQVLAATVGGAVLGNLIAPGIGGALLGGFFGALVGNGSRGKGGK